jgi:hypothetical protein
LNRGSNLIDLPLDDLFMGVDQGKDLERDSDLFQSEDLVQDKGL